MALQPEYVSGPGPEEDLLPMNSADTLIKRPPDTGFRVAATAALGTPGAAAAGPGRSTTHPRRTVLTLRLPWGRTAAGHARNAVRAFLPAPLADTAELLTSELIANAVQHAAPPLHLTVSSIGIQVHCAVSDGNKTPPMPLQPSPAWEHGRGLALVDHLAHRWGSDPTPWGKTVWFQLDGHCND